MKRYRITVLSKFFIFSACLLSIALGFIILSLWLKDTSLMHRVSALTLISLGLFGIIFVNKSEVIIDENKIELQIPFRKKRILFWNEIRELDSGYFLYPETGGVTLIPDPLLGKQPINVSIFGMPLELIHDILSHLSPETKIYLYPYLKRKVEGKQTWFYIK